MPRPPEDWGEDSYGDSWSDLIGRLGVDPWVIEEVENEIGVPPWEWEAMHIEADGDDWTVYVDTPDGSVEIHLDPDEIADIWDLYDLADYYDVDISKDIDTGEASE